MSLPLFPWKKFRLNTFWTNLVTEMYTVQQSCSMPQMFFPTRIRASILFIWVVVTIMWSIYIINVIWWGKKPWILSYVYECPRVRFCISFNVKNYVQAYVLIWQKELTGDDFIKQNICHAPSVLHTVFLHFKIESFN